MSFDVGMTYYAHIHESAPDKSSWGAVLLRLCMYGLTLMIKFPGGSDGEMTTADPRQGLCWERLGKVVLRPPTDLSVHE